MQSGSALGTDLEIDRRRNGTVSLCRGNVETLLYVSTQAVVLYIFRDPHDFHRQVRIAVRIGDVLSDRIAAGEEAFGERFIDDAYTQ